jgi:hypothetical protein
MKHSLTKNWAAKIISLIAAYAIWYVIHAHISDGSQDTGKLTQAEDQRLLDQKLREIMGLLELRLPEITKGARADENRLIEEKLLEIYQLQEKINSSMSEKTPKVKVEEEEK